MNKKQKEKSNKQQKSAKNKKGKKNDAKNSEPDPKDQEPLQNEEEKVPKDLPPPSQPLPDPSARKRSADDGTYDILPLIRIDEYDEDLHLAQMDLIHIRHSSEPPPQTDSHPHHQSHLLRSVGFGRSADSIPFIDDSPRKLPTAAVNFHEERFITIQPQNVGSPALTKSLPSFKPVLPAPRQIMPPVIIVPEDRPEVSREVTKFYQKIPQEIFIKGEEVEHHFRTVPQQQMDAKLCQVCHEFMHHEGAVVRCLTCGLVCHEECAANKVSFFSTNIKNRN